MHHPIIDVDFLFDDGNSSISTDVETMTNGLGDFGRHTLNNNGL